MINVWEFFFSDDISKKKFYFLLFRFFSVESFSLKFFAGSTRTIRFYGNPWVSLRLENNKACPGPGPGGHPPPTQSLVISFPVNLIKLFSEIITKIGISPNTRFLRKLRQKRLNFNSKEEITTDTQVEPPQGCN